MPAISLFLKNSWQNILFAGLITAFVVFKIPYLSLPYYWDEAWFYIRAVNHLYEHGLAFFPGSLPTDLFRGHPPLFHILAASWLKIFGNSPAIAHAFSLCISVGLLIGLYRLLSRWTGKTIALAGPVFLMMQPTFYYQSAFLLPEISVALFACLAFYFLMQDRYILFFIGSGLMLLTKETSVVILISFLLWPVILFILRNDKDEIKEYRLLLKRWLLIHSPLLIFFLYFLIQKIQMGWFFYPEHVGMMKSSFSEILNGLNGLMNEVFVAQGKVFLIPVIAAGITYSVIKKDGITPVILQALFTTLAFLIFCSVNFISQRYLIPILPFYAILIVLSAVKTAELLNLIFRRSKPPLQWITLLFFIPVIFMSRKVIIKDLSLGDTRKGYMHMVFAHRELISFLEKENLRDGKIHTHFLMDFNLRDKACGYISGQPFEIGGPEESKYFIFSSIEYDPQFDAYKEKYQLKSLRKISHGNAFCELFRKP